MLAVILLVAATQAPTATARAVAKPPVIDGRLTDAVWQDVAPITGFIQRELHEGQPVTERTEVRIITDGEALYVGAWMYDSDAPGIIPGDKVRDGDITKADYFGILLDTYHDKQNGFVFTTTPAAIEYDAQVVNEGEGGGIQLPGQTRTASGSLGGFNLNWDATWTVATSVDSAGWYAEFRIPFTTLRYGASQTQTWGLNLVRSIRRKNEEAFWSAIPRQFSLMKISRAGTLEGVQVPSRHVATVTPYALAGVERIYAIDPEARERQEVGGEIKYGLTQSLTLDLTYNTDFAQVEVDEVRTNLTRFPLFYPEKRPFFLENAGTFSAGTPQAVDLFFTRRIGIDALGQPVPIVGGGRITGRLGGLTLGGLEIFTESQGYSVLHVGRELATRSRIGAIAVQRMATGQSGDWNRVLGVDGRIGIHDAWTIDWWGAGSADPGPADRDVAAYSGRVGYETQHWSNVARLIHVGSDFNPEVGFLNRGGGYDYYEAGVMWKKRFPSIPWIKEWIPHVNYRGYYDLNGFWQEGRIHIDVTEFDLANGGRIGPEMNIEHQGLTQPFAIDSNVTLPAGSYDYTSFGFDFASNPSAPLSLTLRADVGEFYNGTRRGGSLTLGARYSSLLTATLTGEYNDVRLDQGDFIRSLVATRVAYFFTPRVMFQALVQYSNQANAWTANARFSWLSTAGNGFFIVYNEGRWADSFFQLNQPQARSVILKYSRQFGRSG
ncbi:MAG TPA: DUF5916 domain-containing protein, partial [Gemmatimonadaceae bacterium]|nr:DUF5916 domain-containing protein [Gemmatimonadaceae bacterium]